MDIVEVTEDRRLVISLEGGEVAALLNTMYQGMKAVEDEEFSILIGLERAEVEAIWEKLDEVYPQVRDH